MFRKKKEFPKEQVGLKTTPAAEQTEKAEAEKAEREQNRKRNFSSRQAETVHMFSVGIIVYTTALTFSYCYAYWKYGVITLMLGNVIFCVIAESFVICWGILWWVQLAPKLLAVKNPLKNYKFSMLIVLLSAPLFAFAIRADMVNGATPIGSFNIIFILFGGRIALELSFAWLEYRRSAKHKRVGFVEYCNEIEI